MLFCKYYSDVPRQSPMHCKIFIEVTNTIARCIASSKQTSQRQSPMYCKIWTDVTKTIDDVLQDLYRSHKDTRTHKDTSHKSQVNQWECCASLLVVVKKSSPQDTLCKIVSNIHFTGVFKQFGNRLIDSCRTYTQKWASFQKSSF